MCVTDTTSLPPVQIPSHLSNRDHCCLLHRQTFYGSSPPPAHRRCSCLALDVTHQSRQATAALQLFSEIRLVAATCLAQAPWPKQDSRRSSTASSQSLQSAAHGQC